MKPIDDVTHTRLCAAIRQHAERLLDVLALGVTDDEVIAAALPDAMTILGSRDASRTREILEDLIEEAVEGPEHTKRPVLPPDASRDKGIAADEAEEAQNAALVAKADLLRDFLEEAMRRGLKPGQKVTSMFAPGEVDRLFPGLPKIMRAPGRGD